MIDPERHIGVLDAAVGPVSTERIVGDVLESVWILQFRFEVCSAAGSTYDTDDSRIRRTCMKIAIIGSGNVGGALASGWSRSGHEILLGVRDASAPEVKALSARTHAVAKSPREAATAGEVVVLALPWGAAEEAVSSLREALAGKIVIDCMNPLVFKDGRLSLDLGFSTSGAETVARWAPQAKVVKTLNQVGAEIMADASGFSSPPAMLMAGNNPAAKATVARLLSDLGFEPLDAGDLSQSRLLEPFGMVWINQAIRQGKGRAWAFAALSRKERQDHDDPISPARIR